jgi:hypothetical protein
VEGRAKYHWREFVIWAAKDLRKEVPVFFDGFEEINLSDICKTHVSEISDYINKLLTGLKV